MSSTAAPIASNASRVCSTVATPSAVRRGALGDDADDVRGLGLDLADQRRDLRRGGLGLLGELADLLGDDGEAAALLAGAGGLDRGVEREQVGLLGDAGDRVDDAADLLGLARRGRSIAAPTSREDVGDRRIASVACAAARDALARRRRGPARRPRRSRVAARRCAGGARRPPGRRSRVDSTMRTWRSAPWATSATAEAISPTARPASSEVDAICCEAEATRAGGAGDLADQRAELRAHRRCRPRSTPLGLGEHRVEGAAELAELVGARSRRPAS